MRRRHILAGLLLALAAPLAAEAQQAPRKVRIGVLSSGDNPSEPSLRFEAFRRELRERGWVEGRNLAIEWRLAEGKNERLPALVSCF
jgi:putative ABC transport system substrate-binding protein